MVTGRPPFSGDSPVSIAYKHVKEAPTPPRSINPAIPAGYEAIVMKAREQQLAGATVLRGPMGFGHSSRLHTTKILRLSENLPIIVEIVDSEEKINAFLPLLDPMMGSGLVTMEKLQVLRYGAKEKA